MSKYIQRIKARKFRKTGLSIIEIAKLVSVSKATVSVWCRDIILTKEQKEKLLANLFSSGGRGRFLGAEANRRKKLEALQACMEWGKSVLSSFSDRDLLIAGSALYWAEGSKTDTTSGFVFVNSDPTMVKFMYVWLDRIMKIPKGDIKPRIAINEIHKPRINTVLRFWSNLLELPISQFGNPWYVRTKVKKVYENYDSYYGILRLGVRRSGILKKKVLSLIKILGDFEKLPR